MIGSRYSPVHKVVWSLLSIGGILSALYADWQWERHFPAISSWLLGPDGEVYVYAWYNDLQPRQVVMRINPNSQVHWITEGGIYQDTKFPRFYPLESVQNPLYGPVGPALQLDMRSNLLNVLLGAYKPPSHTDNRLCEVVYAQFDRNGVPDPEIPGRYRAKLLLVRTLVADAWCHIYGPYGIYLDRDGNNYLTYTGIPDTGRQDLLSECQDPPPSGGEGRWFGGIACNSTAPNRTRWEGRFIYEGLKLLNEYNPSMYDTIPTHLPPMAAADVDSNGNTLMLFYPFTESAPRPFRFHRFSSRFKERVLVYVDSSGEVRWLRRVEVSASPTNATVDGITINQAYRVWVRLGTNYAFTAELIAYPSSSAYSATISCFNKSNGNRILSQEWGVRDIIGIEVSGDKCYVGLVRDSCCSSALCTEIWEVSANGVRQVACHPGRGLAIAVAGNSIGALLWEPSQSCSNRIKIQLWDGNGTPYWSATRCLTTNNSGAAIGRLQMRWSRVDSIRQRLDIGARVVFANSASVDQKSVLVKGQWIFTGDER